MTESFISFAFSAGVLSPSLLSRPDLEKYDLALRHAKNWIVDYRGGITVRPGLEFVGETRGAVETLRLVPFQFNLFEGNQFVIALGNNYIRFIRDGQFVVDSSATLTIDNISNDSIAVVTTTAAHGWTTTELTRQIYLRDTGVAELDNNIFHPGGPPSGSTFTIGIPGVEDRVDLSYLAGATSGGTVELIYEIASPYATADLPNLRFDQFRDEIYITHVDYAPRKLVRVSNDEWTLTEVDFIGNRSAPAAPTITLGTDNAGSAFNPDSGALDAGVLYGITAVNAEGEESYLKAIGMSLAALDITTSRGFLTLEWTAVSGAVSYNIYRSLIITKSQAITFAQQLGYLGSSQGTIFQDTNIIPDFTKTPLVIDNPFANGAVLAVNITALGTGYPKTGTTITVTEGTGFEGAPIINDDGEIIGVRILNPGSGYVGGAISFTGTGGSGATATITTSPATGNWPSCSTQIQQRRVYGGTSNLPMNIFASRVGFPDSFDFSSLNLADDAFDLTLDSPQVTPIYDLVKADLGLLVFTPHQVMQMRTTEDSLLTATTVIAENVSDQGAQPLKPIRAEDNTLYLTYGSYAVNSIQPTQLRNYYQVVDISVFSNHYFTPENPVTSWCMTKTPQSIVWAVRADGTLLTMAYKPEQNVYAWTEHDTEGHFEEIVSITEDNKDVVYALVRRRGRSHIERFDPINWTYERDNFCLDNYRKTPTAKKTSVVEVSAWEGDGVTITSTADTAIFGDVAVGDHILVGGGLLDVTAVAVDDKSVTGNLIYALEERQKTRGYNFRVYTSWEIIPAVTTIRGIYHLEGNTAETRYAIVGDTYVEVTYSTGGIITLPSAMPVRAIGWNLRDSDVVTLPLKLQGAIVEDKKKRIADVSLRMEGAQAFAAGTLSTGELYDVDDNGYKNFELSDYMKSTIYETAVTADWREDDSIVIRKTKPFRGKLLGLVINAEYGLD